VREGEKRKREGGGKGAFVCLCVREKREWRRVEGGGHRDRGREEERARERESVCA